MRYDAVVFDNDGVLIEPVAYDVLVEAAHEAFVAAGAAKAVADRVERMAQAERLALGVTAEILTDVCEAHGLDRDELWKLRDGAASKAQLAEIRAGRMALYEDFDAIRSLAHPLGIVSTNQQATIDFVLDHFGIGELFETAYGREPTVESLRLKKPHPHYLERALADLDAETAIFIGDSETDVQAAERAGVDSAFIRRSHRADLELSVEPTYEIEGLRDLFDIDGIERVASDGGSS
jgi:HAD superfamily hydrolase (TIGR01549 family)